MNGEGYRDPTADRVIRNAGRLPRPIWNVVKAVREVLNVSHLELVEIRMRDRTTGREHTWGGDTNGEKDTGAVHRRVRADGFEEYTYVACGNADVCERCQALDGKHFKVQDMMPGTNAPPMHPRCHCSTAAYEDSAEYEKWLDFLEQGGTTEEWEASKNRKARYKDNEGIFQTLDGRSKGRDVIKPRNIMKEMRKSSIGTEMLEYLQENDIQIKVWYGVDVDEGLDGLFEDGEINIYADNTKTVRETAITVIHEATHAKINKPNTKSQELQCYVNEYRHQNIELTEKVLQDIINHINDKYPNLKWE